MYNESASYLRTWEEYGERERAKQRKMMIEVGFTEEEIPDVYKMIEKLNPHRSIKERVLDLYEIKKTFKEV